MLSVPLQAINYPRGGVEHLDIWANGVNTIVKAPIRPYLITTKQLRLKCDDGCHRSCLDVEETPMTVKLLGSLEERKGWKYSFTEVSEIPSITAQIEKKFPGMMYHVRENHMPFIERVATDAPDFFAKYPENLERQLTFDIETLTEASVDKNLIISIALGDGKEIWSHQGNEVDILENFISDYKRMDPDVVVGYYQKGFDWPYIIRRCNVHNISTDWIARGGKQLKEHYGGRIHSIPGRLQWDVYEDVHDDQTLRLKNNGLKTVAKEFDIPVIEEDTTDTIHLLEDLEKLRKYNESDVNATEKLFTGYFQRSVAIANEVGLPIDMLVNTRGARDGLFKSPDKRAKSGLWTMVSRVIMGRGFVKQGFIETGMNQDRYPDIDWGRRNFQGAFVGSNLSGKFDYVAHFDVMAMYPSIVMAFNISPETTKLVEKLPYDPDVNILKEIGKDYTVFEIADKNLNANAVLHINQAVQGIKPEFLLRCETQRNKFKKLRDKATNDTEHIRWESAQYGMKISANGVGFGVEAPKIIRYGDFWTAMAITGIGRFLIKFSMDFVRSRGFEIIEYDTDGFYFPWGKAEFPHDLLTDLNTAITELVSDWGAAKDIIMEGDLYDCGYFYKTKNYILKGKWSHKTQSFSTKLNIKGSSFKDSKKANIIDFFRDEMAEKVLAGEDATEVIRRFMHPEDFSIKDLAKRITLGQPIDEYKVNSKAKVVALLQQRLLGTKPEVTTSYAYIDGINGPMIVARISPKLIDYDKIKGDIAKVAGFFGYEDTAYNLMKQSRSQELGVGW